jgi:hypothetical protein
VLRQEHAGFAIVPLLDAAVLETDDFHRPRGALERCRPWRTADLWVFGAGLHPCTSELSFSRRIEILGNAL